MTAAASATRAIQPTHQMRVLMSKETVIIQFSVQPDLVVSADPSGNGLVSLQWLNSGDPKQHWTTEPATDGFYLRNTATGTYLTAISNNSPVVLEPHGSIWQKTGPDEQFTTIRLTINTEQNLNALDAYAVVGTAIGTWAWAGSNGNNIWNIANVAAVWPSLDEETISLLRSRGLSPALDQPGQPGRAAGGRR